MDATLALALIVVIVLAIILIRVVDNKGRGTVKFTAGSLLSAEVEFDAGNRESAKQAVRRAAQEKGETDVVAVEREIDQTVRARLVRTLWVDDNPDWNLYETVALEQLGFFVTKSTSTDGALFYLSQLPYALAITDLGR